MVSIYACFLLICIMMLHGQISSFIYHKLKSLQKYMRVCRVHEEAAVAVLGKACQLLSPTHLNTHCCNQQSSMAFYALPYMFCVCAMFGIESSFNSKSTCADRKPCIYSFILSSLGFNKIVQNNYWDKE